MNSQMLGVFEYVCMLSYSTTAGILQVSFKFPVKLVVDLFTYSM